jgi:hypothetical protein
MVDENIFRPMIRELIKYYYQNLGNASGGYLHIVLDDGNLEDDSIWYRQELCRENNDDFGYLIGTILRSFTFEEREKMYNDRWDDKSNKEIK